MTAAQYDTFQARLDRISRSGAGNPLKTLGGTVAKKDPVGWSMPETVRATKVKRKRGLRGLLMAPLVGAGSVVLARLAVFHFGSAQPAQDDAIGLGLAMLGEVGTGAMFGALLVLLFGMMTVPRMLFVALGAVGMFFYEAEVARQAPEQWALAFSSRYVADLKTTPLPDLTSVQTLIGSLTSG